MPASFDSSAVPKYLGITAASLAWNLSLKSVKQNVFSVFSFCVFKGLFTSEIMMVYRLLFQFMLLSSIHKSVSV